MGSGRTASRITAAGFTCLQALYSTYFELVLSFEKKRVSSEEGDMTCPLLILLPLRVFAALTSSTVDAARAPEPGFLSLFGSNAQHLDGFQQQQQQQFRARRQQQQQQQQQGVLGCLTPCTRELRPVRGHQGGREKILPNPCTFQAAQCQARRTRGPPLIKDPNQDDVIFPSI